MIDSHCHLAAPQFKDDVDAVIARAGAAGVTTMICIGDTMEESERGVEIAEQYKEVYCTVGLHPHTSNQWTATSEGKLRSLISRSKKVRAIGEIGLDYHYDLSPREVQRSVFRTQLELA